MKVLSGPATVIGEHPQKSTSVFKQLGRGGIVMNQKPGDLPIYEVIVLQRQS